MSRRRRKKKAAKIIVIAIVSVAFLVFIGGAALKKLFAVAIIAAVIAVCLAILVIILNSPKMKGKRGERKISRLLESLSWNKEAYVVNDVIVPGENGKTSQIDHILFARGGIFVIETKNYAGRIYGNENQHEWTQVLAYGRSKNKLYNPVKQNKTHIYRLGEILGKGIRFYSCVVFINSDLSCLECEGVYSPRELKWYLKDNAFQEKYDHDAIYDAYGKIVEYKEKPIQTTKEHIQEIKQTQRDIRYDICPRCGAPLVLRTSKDGREFYGCSKYPRCKFTKRV